MDTEYNILIVSSDTNFCNSIRPFAEKSGADKIFHAVSINDAERMLMTEDISAIIVNCPLTDGFGLDFAVKYGTEKNYATLVFVRNELCEAVRQKLSRLPVLTLGKPTSPEVTTETLALLYSAAKKLKGTAESCPAADTTKQLKIINRAKLILISSLGMTEEQAHKYIEKRAMEERKTRIFIAQNIITSYGQ